MKLVLSFVLFFIFLNASGQYPISQSLGADSTLVTSRGGLKGRIINYVYADTTAANLERIRQYPGAQIFTSGDTSIWIRSINANKWIKLGSGSGGGGSQNLQQVTDIGNTTNNMILVYKGSDELQMRPDTLTFVQSTIPAYLTPNPLSGTRRWNLPDSSGTIALKQDLANIGNSNLTLTSERTLTGDETYGLTFTDLAKFDVFASPIRFNNNNNTLFITADSTSTTRRIIYPGSLFTPNSLVTRRFVVDSLIGGGITADNGLTKTGNNIQWGGTLLDATDINAGGNDINFSDVGQFSVTADRINLNTPDLRINTLPISDTTQYITGISVDGKLVKTLKSGLPNIYNSNGIFTANRSVNGGGFDFDITDVGQWTSSVSGQVQHDAGDNMLLRGSITSGAMSSLSLYDSLLLNNTAGDIRAKNLSLTDTTTYMVGITPSGRLVKTLKSGIANIYNTDGTLTGNRTVDGDGNDLTFDNNGEFNIAASSGMLFRTTVGDNISDIQSIGAYNSFQTFKTGAASDFYVYPDSIIARPHLGRFIIDSVQAGAVTDSALVWDPIHGNVGRRQAGNINTTGGVTGQVVTWVSGNNFILTTPSRTDSTGTMNFIVGQPSYPEIGDSTITNTGFIGKHIELYRNGLLMQPDTTYGIRVDTTIGRVQIWPAFDTLDRITIKAYNYRSNYRITGQNTGWKDLTFTTRYNIAVTSNVWTPVGGTLWDQYGLDSKTLTGDGSYRIKYQASDGESIIIGFNSSNVNEDYTHYEYGMYLDPGGDVYSVTNGTPAPTGYILSVGDYVMLNRTGNLFTIQTSPDGNTWTTRHTFGTTSTATFYLNLNVFVSGKCYYPQQYGL